MEIFPEPSKLSYEAIEEYAELVGRKHAIYNSDGTADIGALVKKLGGVVETMGSTRTSLLIYGEGNFKIYVPDLSSRRKRVFSMARSIGQYFLHYRYVKAEGTMRFMVNNNALVNTQGNLFASALMMPTKEFAERYVEYGGDSFLLTSIFEVSPLAIDTRAKRLPLQKELLEDFIKSSR